MTLKLNPSKCVCVCVLQQLCSNQLHVFYMHAHPCPSLSILCPSLLHPMPTLSPSYTPPSHHSMPLPLTILTIPPDKLAPLNFKPL